MKHIVTLLQKVAPLLPIEESSYTSTHVRTKVASSIEVQVIIKDFRMLVESNWEFEEDILQT